MINEKKTFVVGHIGMGDVRGDFETGEQQLLVEQGYIRESAHLGLRTLEGIALIFKGVWGCKLS